MSKIELDPITSGYNLSKINANFQKIEDELNNKVLYRNSPAGEPNSMSSNLDMNSKSILNANRVSSNTLELGGVQVVPTNLAIDPYNGTREALRRSYAEAGYNLVDGSFEVGGALVNANDVLLQEASGKAFSGPAGTVAAGTNPASGGFVDMSDKLLRLAPNKLSTYGGNLQLAIDSSQEIVIDVDYELNTPIVVRNNTSIKRGGGVVTVRNGGLIKTETTSPTQYYADNAGAPQLPLAVGVSAGGTSIRLVDASSVSVGDKLVLKNGYCDMWRVLESGDASIQRRAVDATVYKTEIVTVLGKSGNILTTTSLEFDYPATPQTFGFLPDENALSAYSGYTRPSATKLKYSNIDIELDLVVSSDVTQPILHISYVDGLKLSCSGESSAVCPVLMRVTSSIVDVDGVNLSGHTGSVLWVQETSRGTQRNLTAYDWRGGADAPFIVTIMSAMNSSNVDVVSAVRVAGTSAIYHNAVLGGSIVGVQAKGVARCADVSFSKGVVGSVVNGTNCDFLYGAFASSSCELGQGVVRGYCVQNSSTSEFTSTLITCRDTTNMSYSDITRINDSGYGRVRIGNCVGLTLKNVVAKATHLHSVINPKATEPAQGVSNLQARLRDCSFGGLWRESTYYDAADEYGYSYPLSIYSSIKISDGGPVSLGGRFNPSDVYDLFSTATIQLDGGIFGVELTGIAGGISVPTAGKATCFPCIQGLKLFTKPAVGVFAPVDTQMTDGSVWSTSYVNGARISDVYSRKTYTNSGVKGSAPVWLLG